MEWLTKCVFDIVGEMRHPGVWKLCGCEKIQSEYERTWHRVYQVPTHSQPPQDTYWSQSSFYLWYLQMQSNTEWRVHGKASWDWRECFSCPGTGIEVDTRTLSASQNTVSWYHILLSFPSFNCALRIRDFVAHGEQILRAFSSGEFQLPHPPDVFLSNSDKRRVLTNIYYFLNCWTVLRLCDCVWCCVCLTQLPVHSIVISYSFSMRKRVELTPAKHPDHGTSRLSFGTTPRPHTRYHSGANPDSTRDGVFVRRHFNYIVCFTFTRSVFYVVLNVWISSMACACTVIRDCWLCLMEYPVHRNWSSGAR